MALTAVQVQTERAVRTTRQADAIGVAVLVALTAVVGWNRLTFDAWLSRHDLLTFFLPWYHLLGERLRDFDVPGWNPYVLSGTPFAGDPESGWMYLPAMLFSPFLSAIAAFKAMVLLQLAVAGISTYVFGRVMGMGVVASLVAAVVYEFGPFLHQNTYCCTVRAQFATWLPLALLGVELALRTDRWRDRVVPWFVAGFAISQMFSGWLGQGVMNGLLVVAAYIGFRTLVSPPVAGRDLPTQSRLLSGMATGVVILGLGMALGAAGILPRLDVNQASNIPGGDYSLLGEEHNATPYTFEVLLANILGDGHDHRAVALGGGVIVLALLAPVLARRRFAVPFFAGLTLVVYTMTQDTTPLHHLFYLIPRFESLHQHSPHQINAVVMIGPAMLAAAAVESLAAWRGQRRLLPVAGLPLLLIVITALALWWADSWVGWMPLVAAVAATVLVAFVLVAPRGPLWRLPIERLVPLVPVLALALIFAQPTGAELVGSWARHPWDAWGPFWNPDAETTRAIAVNTAESDPGGAGAFLQQQLDEGGPFRTVGYAALNHPDEPPGGYEHRRFDPEIQALIVSGRPMFLGTYEIQGYNPLQLARYDEYMTTLNGRPQDYHLANLLPGDFDLRLLNMLNTRYILIAADLPPDRADVAALTAGKREVFRNEQVVVYENPDAFPRAWIVHDVRGVARDEAARLLSDETIDFRTTALVEGDLPALAPGDPSSESARVVEYHADELTIEATATAPGLLVVGEVYESGWQAYVDGEQVDLLPANLALRGVPIPAGEHVVELRYEPRSLQLGLWISGLATVAMLATFIVTLAHQAKRLVRRHGIWYDRLPTARRPS
ncbi:MAG: YfhO family protein [Thermomicrobiales bacterium]